MYNNNNNNHSPSRRNQGAATATSVGTAGTKSSMTDHSIRRGAEIVRKHIQQQQQHVISNATTTAPKFVATAAPVGLSSHQRVASKPSKQHGRMYDVDEDDFLIHDSDEEVTTEDHISVTSWSEYDVPPTYHHDGGGGGGRYPRRNTGTSSVEIDPPSIADWSIDVEDDDVTFSKNEATHKEEYKEKEEEDDDSLLLEEKDYSKQVKYQNVETLRSRQRPKVPPPIANFDNTTMLMMTLNENLITKHPPVGGFVSSDDEEEEEADEEDKGNDKNNDQDDAFDDSNSDIVEINDALFDPFHQAASHGHDLAVVVSSASPNKISTKLLSTTPTATMVSNHATKEQRSPSNSIDPTDGGGGSSSSGSDSSPYRHRTMGLSTSPNSGAIKKGYPLPLHIQESSPDFKKNSFHTASSNDRNNTTVIANNRANFFMDYDVNAYCGYNTDRFADDGEEDEQYDSPEKPVREVPIHTPSTISNLSSPGTMPRMSNANSQKYYAQKSSAIMLQYDQLLRDPAYLHAQNAGFIWQSIVGQHIRFPSSWWNGARGPPINSGYDDSNSNHPADTSNIPWMYFGRHTIPDHPVLNQLVKCQASAGRLLLHIVVQDLMTRTPIQDIVIGCFHPNSKGIRSPTSPALKRYENCRDIWMAVRKRNHTAVAATDSLIYSPSHWENPKASNSHRPTTSAYNYSISRSPLGSGQRVTNQNVRAVFGDKAPLETIFLSEDELYERLATRILQQQQNALELSSSGINNSNNNNDINSKSDSKMAASATTKHDDLSPPLAILQELVFA
jgi:hypothetical protein